MAEPIESNSGSIESKSGSIESKSGSIENTCVNAKIPKTAPRRCISELNSAFDAPFTFVKSQKLVIISTTSYFIMIDERKINIFNRDKKWLDSIKNPTDPNLTMRKHPLMWYNSTLPNTIMHVNDDCYITTITFDPDSHHKLFILGRCDFHNYDTPIKFINVTKNGHIHYMRKNDAMIGNLSTQSTTRISSKESKEAYNNRLEPFKVTKYYKNPISKRTYF